ncbi:hypothetical protein JCM10550A_08860 [Methanogenium cariaci]
MLSPADSLFMHRFICLIFVSTLMFISAGCLTGHPSPAEDAGGIRLITPGEGFSIFDGQGHYSGLIGDESPDIPANYSLGHVTIPPGNATPPHRLVGSSEFVYLTGGEAEIRCDTTTVTVREGEVVILPDGVLQSITAVGDAPLHYIDVIQPPFSSAVELSGDELTEFTANVDDGKDHVPIVIPDPRKGIAWDIGSDMMLYTLANPVLMPERNFPIDYSVAYAELLPGGSADFNKLAGASELIYVITGVVEVFTPDGNSLRVPAGSVAWIAPDQVKGYRNTGASPATMLSVVDPAWTPERSVAVE